jgi:mono/diheme cytochrome c family protein
MKNIFPPTCTGLALLLALSACAIRSEHANGASSPAVASKVVVNGAEANDGEKIYNVNCSSCHQANGLGVPGTFPPLANNGVVTGDASTVIRIVKYGLTTRLTVAGTAYDGEMPAWDGKISDEDIASAITYIRSAWGNDASAIASDAVSSDAVR